ncbi:hypothetical protein FQR65_LT14724 [Abscondita terminalis]|nr:hypothetical protein FQR65_LT14724 [Abscondita terminalis]
MNIFLSRSIVADDAAAYGLGTLADQLSLGQSAINGFALDGSGKSGRGRVVGYGKRTQSEYYGSVASVNAEQLKNIALQSSITLAGRAQVCNVTNSSGMAGASSSLRIRGSFAELCMSSWYGADKAAFDHWKR